MTGREKSKADYPIEILGKNVQITDAMKNYAQEKLSKVEKLRRHIKHIHVTMDIEHMQHKVVIVAKVDHFKVRAYGESTDMYASVDQAVDRLEKQLHRWKDRIQDHSQKKMAFVDMEVHLLNKLDNEIEEFNAEIAAANAKRDQDRFQIAKVVGKKTIPLKELTVEEALMKMELSHDHFLLYRSEEDRKLKVLYRRKDGNYGIIQADA